MGPHQSIYALMRLFNDCLGGIPVKKLRKYSPPFRSFLMKALMTGRIITIEKCHLDGALSQRADSG